MRAIRSLDSESETVAVIKRTVISKDAEEQVEIVASSFHFLFWVTRRSPKETKYNFVTHIQ